ncbi:hypothetical protein HanIR_Chr03g0147891 [Helianthus annuus]|nr:hypothetical protein HanIR_Chr03g0147891 [Helianthus annuus]
MIQDKSKNMKIKEHNTESPLNLHTILLLEKQNRLVQACNQSSLSLEEFCNCQYPTLKQVRNLFIYIPNPTSLHGLPLGLLGPHGLKLGPSDL